MGRGRTVLEAGILALAAALVHLPALQGPACYDDVAGIELNPRLRDWGRLGRYVLDPADPYSHYPWRPVTEASFALQMRLFGAGIPGLRLGNLAIHILGAWCVLSLARTLLPGRSRGPWAAALLFAVHPLAGLCVDYPYQRSVALVALLGMLCLKAYLAGRPGWAWAAGLLAMGCKESAVTIPLSLGVLEVVGRSPGGWRRWAPFALLPLLPAVQVARALAAGLGGGPVLELGPAGYLRAQGEAFVHYLRMHALPDAGHFWHAPPDPGYGWLLLLPPAAAAAWVVLGPARHRWARLGAGLMLAPHALESTAFPMQSPVFDYRCNAGLVGAGILLGGAVDRIRGGRALAGAALLLLGAVSARGAALWADPPAFQAWEFRAAYGSPFPLIPRAWGHLVHGRPGLAGRLFAKTLAAAPGLQLARLGLVLSEDLQGRGSGRFPEALRSLRMTNPSWGLFLHHYLGDLGRQDLAEEALRQALALYPDLPPLWENLGVAQARAGRAGEAEASFRRALALEEDFPEAWNDLAVLLAGEGRLDEAEAAVRRALSLRPRYAMAWLNLSLFLDALGRAPEAAEARRRWAACPRDPRLPPPPG